MSTRSARRPAVPENWTFEWDELENRDMEYPDFHVGCLTQFAVMAYPTGWSTVRPVDASSEILRSSWPRIPIGGPTVQSASPGRWVNPLEDGRYELGGVVVAVAKGDFFAQDACECWSLMPNCVVDCGILVMARLYKPGEHVYSPEHRSPDARGLFRPEVGDFVTGEVRLHIHIPEVRKAPACIYTWKITGLKGSESEALASTTEARARFVSACLTRAQPATMRNDLAIVILPTRMTRKRLAVLADVAGVDPDEAEGVLASAPTPLQSRLTWVEAHRMMSKLRRAGIHAAPSHVPRRSSGEDVAFNPDLWDYGPDDYIPTKTWGP